MYQIPSFGFGPGSTMSPQSSMAPVFPAVHPQMGGAMMPPIMASPAQPQPGGLSGMLSSPQGLMQAASLLKGFGAQGANQPPAPKPGSQLSTLPPSSANPGLLQQLWSQIQGIF